MLSGDSTLSHLYYTYIAVATPEAAKVLIANIIWDESKTLYTATIKANHPAYYKVRGALDKLGYAYRENNGSLRTSLQNIYECIAETGNTAKLKAFLQDISWGKLNDPYRRITNPHLQPIAEICLRALGIQYDKYAKGKTTCLSYGPVQTRPMDRHPYRTTQNSEPSYG